MQWCLILEEYSPELNYIKGEKNVVADALSRLRLTEHKVLHHDAHFLSELFATDLGELPTEAFPLHYKALCYHQQQDKKLLHALDGNPAFHLKTFHGGGKKRTLICYKDKIVVPDSQQKRVVNWYHHQLCHPGINRTEETIKQHFWWQSLRDDVQSICSRCNVCQVTKKSTKHYGHLPEKEAEAQPWDKLCVDLVGPYIIKRKAKQPLTLWCLTMIDPATGWFEMCEIKNKEAATIANLVEQTWLSRYPWPTQIVFDKGGEFMAEFAQMTNDYGIKRRGTTTRNPQANAILERIHQTIGNIIRTFGIQDLDVDETNPFAAVLSAAMFAVRSTYHTTLQATPAQLVFGRDSILNIAFEANWKFIQENKQKLIHKNNQRENAKRIPHTYQVGDKVLFSTKTMSKFGQDPWEGPYHIRKVNNNGTVCLQMGSVTDTVNIRLIKPFHQ